MDKKQRIKYLTSLAKSNEGTALKEHFEELIRKMVDVRSYTNDDFEMEGKAAIKAVAVLEKILKDLSLLKKPKKDRERNPYV